MTTLKQGDLIKDEDGNTRKVLGVCGEVVHISCSDDHDDLLATYTEPQLKRLGYTWDTPAWEPSYGMKYWFANSRGEAVQDRWDDQTQDHARRDFLGIYETKELCEAALLEIRRKLGK